MTAVPTKSPTLEGPMLLRLHLTLGHALFTTLTMTLLFSFDSTVLKRCDGRTPSRGHLVRPLPKKSARQSLLALSRTALLLARAKRVTP